MLRATREVTSMTHKMPIVSPNQTDPIIISAIKPNAPLSLGERKLLTHTYSTEGRDGIPYCAYYSVACEGQVGCRFCHLEQSSSSVRDAMVQMATTASHTSCAEYSWAALFV